MSRTNHPWKLETWREGGATRFCYSVTHNLGDKSWLNSNGHRTCNPSYCIHGQTFFQSLEDADDALDKWIVNRNAELA